MRLNVAGFSLLGPYADWMDRTNGYRMEGDVGAAMALGDEYRWNVPMVTYAFDQSFLDYFGSNGVAAVEATIQVINELPAASQVNPDDYPTHVLRQNYTALAGRLVDLKFATLPFLLEQMGLCSPTRHVFDLRRFDPGFLPTSVDENRWPTGAVPNLILERNYDPITLQASHWVNGSLYSGSVVGDFTWDHGHEWWDVLEFAVDPLSGYGSAIADWSSMRPLIEWNPARSGIFAIGLTRDDVAGLRYLLSRTNVNLETLLPDVRRCGRGSGPLVRIAPRPGLEKVTFRRHTMDSQTGQPLPMTLDYVDNYYENGQLRRQPVRRIVAQPDFLFGYGAAPTPTTYGEADVTRTDTALWWRSTVAGGDPHRLGPGVIRPPIRITFQRPACYVFTSETSESPSVFGSAWGSFDGSTNAPVTYPQGSASEEARSLTVGLSFPQGDGVDLGHWTWKLAVPLGSCAALQMSTNLADWETVLTVTNLGGPVQWTHYGPYNLHAQRFFRAVPLVRSGAVKEPSNAHF
jgi:hypothetical protein